MTSASSLVLIAIGAVLAFAVSFQIAGINIQTIGAILMVVGGIGLAISLATLAGYAPWGRASAGDVTTTTTTAAPPTGLPPANV